jgi:hypothetical protein
VCPAGKDAKNERAEDEDEAQAYLDVVEALRLAALALDLSQLSPPWRRTKGAYLAGTDAVTLLITQDC